MNKLIGAEKGMLEQLAFQLAIRNTQPDKAVNKDILLSCLEIVCEFHKDCNNIFDKHFPIENKQEVKIQKINL
jgi:hypothetical protein